MSVLAARDVTIEREGLPIVRQASLDVDGAAITVLLGLNGAGKTTLLEGISGAMPLVAGEVTLDGVRIERLPSYRRSQLGLAHVEQGRTVFGELTTEENIRVAARDGDVDAALELFPELRKRRDVVGGLLSGGEQQMLVLARAFARRPKALLIDELSLGLAPVVLERLIVAIEQLAATGMAILLVEQFAELALQVGRRAHVLRGGELVYDGTCEELRDAPGLLQQLYLGEVDEGARR